MIKAAFEKNIIAHLIFCFFLWGTLVSFLFSGFLGGSYLWGGNVDTNTAYPTPEKLISKPWAILAFGLLIVTVYLNPFISLVKFNNHK